MMTLCLAISVAAAIILGLSWHFSERGRESLRNENLALRQKTEGQPYRDSGIIKLQFHFEHQVDGVPFFAIGHFRTYDNKFEANRWEVISENLSAFRVGCIPFQNYLGDIKMLSVEGSSVKIFKQDSDSWVEISVDLNGDLIDD